MSNILRSTVAAGALYAGAFGTNPNLPAAAETNNTAATQEVCDDTRGVSFRNNEDGSVTYYYPDTGEECLPATTTTETTVATTANVPTTSTTIDKDSLPAPTTTETQPITPVCENALPAGCPADVGNKGTVVNNDTKQSTTSETEPVQVSGEQINSATHDDESNDTARNIAAGLALALTAGGVAYAAKARLSKSSQP